MTVFYIQNLTSMKLNKTFLFASFLFFNLLSIAQIDAVKIASAQKAYDEKDYKSALEELNQVSKTGQKIKLYLYYKGYSFYSLEQLDSAKKYFKKYLILDVNNKETFETLTEVENRLKWFAEAPPRLETITWLKTKIDNSVYIKESMIEVEGEFMTDRKKQTYNFKNDTIYVHNYLPNRDVILSTNKISINDIYKIHKTEDCIFLYTNGKKVSGFAVQQKLNRDNTNLFILRMDFSAEPGLLNKMYKAFSNIALENVKNMPTETY